MLQRFESRLEQAVSGAFAKAFRSAVQPVELAAALQREADNSAQVLSRDRRLVPNTFHIELSPTDHERLTAYTAALTGELVDLLREHAEEQRYVFAGPVSIDFSREDDLVTGRFRVRSRADAEVVAHQEDDATAVGFGRRGGTTILLEVNGTSHVVTPPGMVLGRGAEADLRISDPGVSRRHAEVRVIGGRRGAPVVTVADLGSTNGTLVDGQRIDEAELRDGSVVRVGSTDLRVRFRDAGPDPTARG